MKYIYLLLLCLWGLPAAAEEQQEYLYYRDVSVAPYQHLREFFDMPNRPGVYQVTLVSDALGPLTFALLRVDEDVEMPMQQVRSYHIGDHEFHGEFRNKTGLHDLLVEITNSNPILGANISLIVVELPKP